MVLSTSDLNAVGINTQLTSNDLVEVVANDIYEKILASLNEYMNRGKELKKKWYSLFDKEFASIKNVLLKNKIITEKEDVHTEFNYDKKYWTAAIKISIPFFTEKDKGIKVETSDSHLNYNSGESIKIKLCLSVTEYDKDNKVSINGIEGNIETTISKKFYKIISISDSRFKTVVNEIKEYNKEVEECLSSLPKGLLSVERFTREARVKMNKKIISGQSPEFRQKMSQLFNINL